MPNRKKIPENQNLGFFYSILFVNLILLCLLLIHIFHMIFSNFPHLWHGLIKSLRFRFTVPHQSLSIILFNTSSMIITLSKEVLRVCATLFSGFTIP